MSKDSLKQSFIIGLAMFSMFFGSGNLIFPLSVGKTVGDQYLVGALGFILTAVFVPFLGIVAMIVYNGNYREFFQSIGRIPGFLITLTILCFWIPFGSGPRCITLAFAALQDDLGFHSLPVFSFFYTLLVIVLSLKKNRIIHILGIILTPLLLSALGAVIYLGLSDLRIFPSTEYASIQALQVGLLEGYNTMDLIASFFFSSTVIGILSQKTDKNSPLAQTARASVIAVIILGGVYLGLMALASAHADKLLGLSKDKLLPFLAGNLLGQPFGIIASVAIALACLTTSIALATVFTDFLFVDLFKKKLSRTSCLFLTSIITFIMACLGFETISALSTPVFQILYPMLIGLIILNLGFKKWWKKESLLSQKEM